MAERGENGTTAAWDELCALVEQQMAERNIPGVALGVVHNGVQQTAAWGITNVDHPLPVDDTTLFQIGSITKVYTGTAAMALVEQGALDLDAPIRSYLPDFAVQDADVSAAVTVRHLLAHTCGWFGDFFWDTGPGEDALDAYVREMQRLPQLTELGQCWSYNNAAFALLGRVIETVTSTGFDDALRNLVFAPLGLHDSHMRPAAVMTQRFVSGHAIDGDESPRVVRPWELPRSLGAGGGVISTISDVLGFARFHLGDGTGPDGTPVLQPASIAAMQTEQIDVRQNEYWGLAWALRDVGGLRLAVHSGMTTGHVARLLLVPEHDFAIAVTANAWHGMALIDQVVRRSLGVYFGVEDPPPAGQSATAAELEDYVGAFESPFSRLETSMVDGRLMAQVRDKMAFPSQHFPPPDPPPPIQLDLCGPERLIMIDGPYQGTTIDVMRSPEGDVAAFRIGGRISPRTTS